MMAKKNVLFVTYGGGHATMVAPVVHYLNRHYSEQITCTNLALTTGGVLFQRGGLAHLGFADFLEATDAQARIYGERLLGNDYAAHTGISHEESIAYLGLSYADLVVQYGEEEAARRYAAKGRMAFLPLGTMRRVFDRVKPDLVVTTTSPRAEEAARILAKEQGIASIVMTDLMGTFSHPIDADYLIAANTVGLENYQRLPQVRVEEYHVLGNPAMDRLQAYRTLDIAAYKRAHYPQASWNKPIILLDQQLNYYIGNSSYDQWSDDARMRVLETIYAITRDLGACLFIRPHPSMDRSFYADWIARNGYEDAIEAGDYDIGPLLRCANAVISGHSTLMLDAAYSQTPVVECTTHDGTQLLGFDVLGFAYNAVWENDDSMKAAISAALKDHATNTKHAQRFQELFPGLPCAPAIADLIFCITSKKA